jgi:hypothetical protein
MRSIHENCGAAIAEATAGDASWSALLAAITANESGGCRQTYRFAPENHQRLVALLEGSEAKVEGLTRAQLEKALGAAKSDLEHGMLLKKLAGLHGYTQIAGYHSIGWKTSLEALVEKERHFQFAVRLLQRYCEEFGLEPSSHAVELGRCWNAGHPNGATRSPLYSWRLQERMRIYREMDG